ncbi:hypothetical protein YC2023_116080 [Brassica napus]
MGSFDRRLARDRDDRRRRRSFFFPSSLFVLLHVHSLSFRQIAGSGVEVLIGGGALLAKSSSPVTSQLRLELRAEAMLLSLGGLRHSRAVVSVFFSGLEFVPLSVSERLVWVRFVDVSSVHRWISKVVYGLWRLRVLLRHLGSSCQGTHPSPSRSWTLITNVEMVLGRVIDRLRVNIWFRSILGRVWRLGHLAFCLVPGGIGGSSWFLELLGKASYSGDDIGTPGIRGNEENLTFLCSSPRLLLLPLSGLGLRFDGPVGDVNELFKLPLHEAVLLEPDEGKSPLRLVPDPLRLMLSRLGNLCIVIGDGVGDWNEEWLGGGAPAEAATSFSAEYSCLVSVAAISVTWSFEDDAGAAGMKKFAFAGIGGLADFA